MEPDDNMDEMSQMAVMRLANQLEARLKNDVIDGVKGSLGQLLERVKDSLEKALRESRAEHDRILEPLQDRLLSSGTEKTRLDQYMKILKETVKTVLKELSEAEDKVGSIAMEKYMAEKKMEAALSKEVDAEKKLQEANRINEELSIELNSYKEVVSEAVTLAEKFFNDKIQLEKRLAQLQKTWERGDARR